MDAPHYIQVGAVPVFTGTGVGDLTCRCGQSVLIKGYLPGNYVGIRIRCFRCGEVMEMPGLPEGEILPQWAALVAPQEVPAVQTLGVAPGAVVACAAATARTYELTRPRTLPDVPLGMTRDLVEEAAAAYDRLTSGQLIAQIEASASASGDDPGAYPFAWSVHRLRGLIDKPDWSWLHQNDDALAAIHVVAMHNLVQVWGHHPLFARLAARAGEAGEFLRTICTFATAKLLYETGNRVGFSDDFGLHFSTALDEPLSLALLEPPLLQWRERERRNPATLKDAVIDAIGSVRSRVNRLRPGLVVLAVSIWHPDFDQMLVDAMQAALHEVGRRHRGVAAVAAIMPKGLPAGALDRIGFGYAFYPIINPRFFGENPIKVGPWRN
ncbi:MAG TPA: hypothetical protein VKQ27_01300 [Acetobacteraceae bacterium]|nr:hypothetical protein [Acetobacteraceae bacterium]